MKTFGHRRLNLEFAALRPCARMVMQQPKQFMQPGAGVAGHLGPGQQQLLTGIPPPPPPSENVPHLTRGSTSSNFIDLNSELSLVHKKIWEHDYVNYDVAD
ncbi:Hypothetical predicted protein [Cloeon dipterum]|uniref:Uncharacterized protein n=1 Tax=Cloeon dipterum TaxID=197152 RepID=A0A8S1DUK1_9INSE|nr:Hypothetical predicted protein [Cloeon dipterum]